MGKKKGGLPPVDTCLPEAVADHFVRALAALRLDLDPAVVKSARAAIVVADEAGPAVAGTVVMDGLALKCGGVRCLAHALLGAGPGTASAVTGEPGPFAYGRLGTLELRSCTLGAAGLATVAKLLVAGGKAGPALPLLSSLVVVNETEAEGWYVALVLAVTVVAAAVAVAAEPAAPPHTTLTTHPLLYTRDALGTALCSNKTLRTLRLESCSRLSDAGFGAICGGLRVKKNLHTLVVTSAALTAKSGAHAAKLLAEPHAALAVLDLSNNHLRPDGLLSLAAGVAVTRTLAELSLRAAGFGFTVIESERVLWAEAKERQAVLAASPPRRKRQQQAARAAPPSLGPAGPLPAPSSPNDRERAAASAGLATPQTAMAAFCEAVARNHAASATPPPVPEAEAEPVVCSPVVSLDLQQNGLQREQGALLVELVASHPLMTTVKGDVGLPEEQFALLWKEAGAGKKGKKGKK